MLEEGSVVVGSDGASDFTLCGQAATHGSSKGNSTRVGSGGWAVNKADVSVNNSKLDSVGVVASVVGPGWNTKELGVGLSKADVGLTVTNGNPGVGGVAHGDPDVNGEEWLSTVGLDGLLDLLLCGKATSEGLGVSSRSVPCQVS